MFCSFSTEILVSVTIFFLFVTHSVFHHLYNYWCYSWCSFYELCLLRLILLFLYHCHYHLDYHFLVMSWYYVLLFSKLLYFNWFTGCFVCVCVYIYIYMCVCEGLFINNPFKVTVFSLSHDYKLSLFCLFWELFNKPFLNFRIFFINLELILN